MQPSSTGAGPLYHRTYSIEIASSRQNALAAMHELQTRMNDFSPQYLASIENRLDNPAELNPGDEMRISLSAPWNAPVRVLEVSPDGFKLATLEGHLEAGQISFRTEPLDDGIQRFEIESLARSKDLIVDFFYDTFPIAKAAQTHMWEQVCQHFADRAGSPIPETERTVKVTSEKRDEATGHWIES